MSGSLRGHRLWWDCSVIALRAGRDSQAAYAWKFQRGAADVEAEHRAEEIDLDPLDPADGHAEIARQRGVEPGAGRRDAGPASAIGKVLADGGRRQHGAQLGNGVQRRLHEGVRIWSRPGAVVAIGAELVILDDGTDLGN